MPKGRVSIFVTCLVDQVSPNVGMAMAEVLERVGYEVVFPEAQTCCGQPAFNSGYWGPAREMAQHTVEALRDADAVVVPSGSCTAMMTHHYGELGEGLGLADRVWEFSRFLLEVAGVEDVGARFAATVTYHDSCHALRELGIKDGPRRLLSHVRGLTLKEMDIAEECCGFGGTFSVKFPEVSGAMARTKIESIQRTGASVVVGGDVSCLLQLQGALDRARVGVRTMHLAEILAGGGE